MQAPRPLVRFTMCPLADHGRAPEGSVHTTGRDEAEELVDGDQLRAFAGPENVEAEQ